MPGELLEFPRTAQIKPPLGHFIRLGESGYRKLEHLQSAGRLPLVALVVLAAHVPIAFAGQALAGLWGLAIALAISTALALAWLLVLLDALRATLGDLLTATVVVGAMAAVSFAVCAWLLGPVVAATLALVVYAGVMLVVRPPGLVRSWDYLRALR